MDKNTLTGLMLIGLILIGFSYFNQQEQQEVNQQTNEVVEHKKDVAIKKVAELEVEKEELIKKVSLLEDSTFLATVPANVKSDSTLLKHYVDSVETINRLAEEKAKQKALEGEYGIFYPASEGKQEYITLENDKLIIKFNSKGGQIAEVKLKKYQSYKDYIGTEDSIPLLLIEEQSYKQSLKIENNGKKIETENLYFEPLLDNTDSTQILTFKAQTNEEGKYLLFTYVLANQGYDLDFLIDYKNLQSDINTDNVELDWAMKGLSMEKLTSDERMITCVMYRYFDEKRDYISERSSDEAELESATNWIAFKQKFFSAILINDDKSLTQGHLAQEQLEGNEYTIAYAANVVLPPKNTVDLKFYFGPNEYQVLKSYDAGMEDIINLGWGIFGLVNKWMIQPIFNLLRSTGFSYGLIIFLVTLFVKVLITPLTYKNYLSSAKMRVLKPEIEEINERMKDADAIKRQQAISELYAQTGVNPMAGCVPMLIQMPILLAVFRFFPSNIHLRHQRFLWAEDLSSYDSIYDFGFNIPLYGDHISLFAIMMAISTYLYTKMNSGQMAQTQQPGMPNMNVIMYMMPFMMLFFFNSYSSGLSYYYLCGNLMNMGIMWGIKTYMIDEEKIRAKLAENKKKPKKKSRFQQKMEELAKQQELQKSKSKK